MVPIRYLSQYTTSLLRAPYLFRGAVSARLLKATLPGGLPGVSVLLSVREKDDFEMTKITLYYVPGCYRNIPHIASPPKIRITTAAPRTTA